VPSSVTWYWLPPSPPASQTLPSLTKTIESADATAGESASAAAAQPAATMPRRMREGMGSEVMERDCADRPIAQPSG
jgi:hypothetical protein